MGDKKKQASGRRIALYRKYRSKSLDDIVGQEHITQTLKNAIKLGKISHAYLFTGPRGTGKTSIARILAHEINNIPYTDESTHLDIVEIDAASNRRIDDIRDLRDKVHIAPLSVKYKVYIIDEVHMLTTESFNALLKTLEEPPEHVVFILATTEVHKLPATIISRTQRYSFKSIPTEKVFKLLKTIAKKESINITDEALELLAYYGNGSLRDSISMLDQLGNMTTQVDLSTVELLLGVAPKSQLESLLSQINSGDTALTIDGIGKLIEAGLTPSGIANQLALIIRERATIDTISEQEINLLSDLLTVQGAIYPKLTLESILLKYCLKSGVSSKNPAHDDKKAVDNVKAAEQKVASVVNNSQKEDLSLKKTTKIDPGFSVTKVWPNILESVKLKNNSLYTVLRLASPELDQNKLVLAFAFGFHQKRVDDIKNKKLISEILLSECGYELEVETKIDKSIKASSEASQAAKAPLSEDSYASVIDTVRDIMGGGEIVDV